MNRYFNLKLENPEQNGNIIEVNTSVSLETRLKDYIASYSNPNDNLRIKLTRKPTKIKPAIYQVTIPKMQFSAGACAPAVAVDCGSGWSKKGEDIVSLVLENDNTLKPNKNKPKSKKGEQIYVSEITEEQAKKAKHSEFLWGMQQLYMAGM